MILVNTIYLFTVSPYSDPSNSTLDKVNCVFLLGTCVLMAAFSAWNTSTNERFVYGIVFDGLMGFQFLVNSVLIVT